MWARFSTPTQTIQVGAVARPEIASETGTTRGGTVDYHQDAKDLADEASGGRAVPTKIKDVFLVTNAANPQINGYYGPNADGALVLQGDRLEDVDVDEATKIHSRI